MESFFNMTRSEREKLAEKKKNELYERLQSIAPVNIIEKRTKEGANYTEVTYK